jgi:phage tail sheath protein FI
MPVLTTYPGVYIEELPSGVRTISPVATSITAFVGRVLKGPVNEPTVIKSYGDFERLFGGLWRLSPVSYAVQQFYMNGGSEALIVRVHNGAGTTVQFSVPGTTLLTIEAANPGSWANGLGLAVDYDTSDGAALATSPLFNLFVLQQNADPPNTYSVVESFRNLSVVPTAKRFITNVLKLESQLVRVANPLAASSVRPNLAPVTTPPNTPMPIVPVASVTDGNVLMDADVLGSQSAKTGIYALEKADLFNLLCIPPLEFGTDPDPAATLAPALTYCKDRRAMLIVDSPAIWLKTSDVTNTATGVDSLALRDPNAALFFPRLRMPDALQENRLEEFVPCGAICGVIARTDVERGVWKAPAGLDATLAGVRELTYKLTDGEQGDLNPLAVNCLRTFPVVGHVVWGARTTKGADRLASEWKYLPVRRVTLYIEESLYRGTQWVVFEPNDEPLWAQIRIAVGAFMHRLFKQGAFQGQTARDAYLVKCDAETTTQSDIDLGIVNILVAFAPLKPAEFVIVKIQQKARLPET